MVLNGTEAEQDYVAKVYAEIIQQVKDRREGRDVSDVVSFSNRK